MCSRRDRTSRGVGVERGRAIDIIASIFGDTVLQEVVTGGQYVFIYAVPQLARQLEGKKEAVVDHDNGHRHRHRHRHRLASQDSAAPPSGSELLRVLGLERTKAVQNGLSSRQSLGRDRSLSCDDTLTWSVSQTIVGRTVRGLPFLRGRSRQPDLGCQMCRYRGEVVRW